MLHRLLLILAVIFPWATRAQTSPTIQVKTVADLVALNIPAVASRFTAIVSGRVTTNDGGGGIFIYEASAVSTNAGTRFPSAGAGLWLRQYDGALNARWFGTDTSAVQAAINAASGAPVFVPHGFSYTYASLTNTSSMLLEDYTTAGSVIRNQIEYRGLLAGTIPAKGALTDGMSRVIQYADQDSPFAIRTFIHRQGTGYQFPENEWCIEAYHHPALIIDNINPDATNYQASVLFRYGGEQAWLMSSDTLGDASLHFGIRQGPTSLDMTRFYVLKINAAADIGEGAVDQMQFTGNSAAYGYLLSRARWNDTTGRAALGLVNTNYDITWIRDAGSRDVEIANARNGGTTYWLFNRTNFLRAGDGSNPLYVQQQYIVNKPGTAGTWIQRWQNSSQSSTTWDAVIDSNGLLSYLGIRPTGSEDTIAFLSDGTVGIGTTNVDSAVHIEMAKQGLHINSQGTNGLAQLVLENNSQTGTKWELAIDSDGASGFLGVRTQGAASHALALLSDQTVKIPNLDIPTNINANRLRMTNSLTLGANTNIAHSSDTNYVVDFDGPQCLRLYLSTNLNFLHGTNKLAGRSVKLWLYALNDDRTMTLPTLWKRKGSTTFPTVLTNGTTYIVDLDCFGDIEADVLIKGEFTKQTSSDNQVDNLVVNTNLTTVDLNVTGTGTLPTVEVGQVVSQPNNIRGYTFDDEMVDSTALQKRMLDTNHFVLSSTVGTNNVLHLPNALSNFVATATVASGGAVVLSGALRLSNGTNAQQIAVDDTYTDPSNYRRGIMSWSHKPGTLWIGTTNNGTGAAQPVDIGVGGVSAITVLTNGNVGVGSSPVARFDVFSDNLTGGAFRITRASTPTSYASIAPPQGGATGVRFYNGATTVATFYSNGGVGVGDYTDVNVAPPSKGLVVSGLVGIGTVVPTSTLHTAGSVAESIAVGGAVTLGETNMVYMVNTDAQLITLPTAVGKRGRKYEVWLVAPADTGTLTNATGAELLNGALSISMSGTNKVWMTRSDGTNWWVTVTTAP